MLKRERLKMIKRTYTKSVEMQASSLTLKELRELMQECKDYSDSSTVHVTVSGYDDSSPRIVSIQITSREGG